MLIGVLGFVGVLGPTAEKSLFGPAWYFDNAENWAHLVIGLVGLVAAFVLKSGMQKSLVLLLGVVAVLFGLYSLFISENFLGAMLQNPADTILHLVVGAWALFAGLKKPKMAAMSMPPQQQM